MTLAELRAAIGAEVLAVTGGREQGYTMHRGLLQNVSVNGVYYSDRTEMSIRGTVAIQAADRMPMPHEFESNRIFPVSQEAQVDAKITRLNASIAEINSEGI